MRKGLHSGPLDSTLRYNLRKWPIERKRTDMGLEAAQRSQIQVIAAFVTRIEGANFRNLNQQFTMDPDPEKTKVFSVESCVRFGQIRRQRMEHAEDF